MSVQVLLQRSRLFAAKGPGYALAYAQWRVVRFVARLQQRLHPPVWPSLPALQAAGIASGTSAVEAGPALATYLAVREHPSFHFSVTDALTIVQQVSPKQRANTLSKANTLLRGQHIYRGIQANFDAALDWQHAPSNSMDWRWDLNRHFWLTTLARAWRYTGDEAFARHAVRLLCHWMAHNPPDVRNPVWRPFEVATRLNNWIWGLHLLVDCPVFAQEGVGYLWQGLVAQARYLFRHLEHHIANNHLLIEAKTLAMLGLLFPELSEAARWLQTGLEILWTQVRRQFYPDGVHTEQATQYHTLCTGELWEMLNLLRRNSFSIPSDILDRFEAAVDFQTTILKLDGHIPLFGDSARHDLHRRFDARWASVWLGKRDLPTNSPNEETAWLLGAKRTIGAPGTLPESRAYPDGGYVVMRDAASYLVLDCGPFGDEMVPSHAHADALSLEVSAFGQTLLTDSGGYSYHAPSVWRDYFRGTRAHNTVVVDDTDQSQLVGRREAGQRAQARLLDWVCAPLADWAVAEHDGYTRLPDPVTHRRRVLFVGKGSELGRTYWLLVDSLMGAIPHQTDWHFHLHPDADWSLETDTNSLQARIGEIGMRIAPAPTDSLTAKVVSGQLSPPLGWVSLESGQKEPAPTFVLSQKSDLPRHLPVVLLPHKLEQSTPVVFRTLKVGKEMLVVSVTTPQANDLIAIALGDTVTSLCLDSLKAVARVLVWREFNNSEPMAYVLGAQAIHVENRELWRGTASWVSLAQENDAWVVADLG